MLKQMQLRAVKVLKNSKNPNRLKILGYTGAAVDLSDHGLDAPVYYNLNTLKIKNQVLPIMYNHRTEVGQTIKNAIVEGKQIVSEGELTVENKASKRIANALDKEFPYQASMGIDATGIKISYVPEGEKRIINQQKAVGPFYIIDNALMDEMTITAIGRDTNTKVHKLSRTELMRIKNSAKRSAKPAPKKKVNNQLSKEQEEQERPVRNKTRVNNQERTRKPSTKQRVNNTSSSQEKDTGLSRTDLSRILNWQRKFPECSEVIELGLERGHSLGRIKNAIKIYRLENNLQQPAHVGSKKDDPTLEARLLAAVCENPEKTVEKHYGKQVRDRVLNMSQIGLKELMILGCRRAGHSFTGFSDIDIMCNTVRAMNRQNLMRIENVGFSTFDMPNMFQRITQFTMEESWKIEGMFAAENCYTTSNPDFRKTERFRPAGGSMWEGLDGEGKIKHGTGTQDVRYTTGLDTKAQMLVFNREMIENDDIGGIKEVLALMAEGAQMVPDFKLMNRMWQANGSFFVSNTNDFTLALNDTNLTTIYNAARDQRINKDGVTWVNRFGDMWDLVIPPALERTAWELLKQTTLIGPTGSRQGQGNYWAGKLNIKVFNQLSNTTMNTNAQTDAWFLWPTGTKYAPWAITYLRGKRTPTVEVKEVPADMLGFAVRGYFDVEVNDREKSAVIRSRPTGSIS